MESGDRVVATFRGKAVIAAGTGGPVVAGAPVPLPAEAPGQSAGVEPGEVRWDGGAGLYRLRLRPDVRLHAKRLFPRLPREQAGELVLPEREDLALDLLHLIDRWELRAWPGVPERLAECRRAWRARQQALRAAIAGGAGAAAAAPARPLALPPRDYQRQVADLALLRGGLLCADDLGLGKTVSGIETINRPGCVPALVVTETHLVRQWVRELRRFAPHLRVAEAQRAEPHGLPPWDVLVLNYHKLAAWASHLASVIRCLILDEIQNLRHHTTGKYAGALALAEGARVRLGLSATPVYNYGGEIWALLNVLLPGHFGAYDDWAREWDCTGPERRKHRLRDPAAFAAYLAAEGIQLRRTRAEVGRELPPCQRIVHTVDADPEAFRAVDGRAAELARLVLARSGTRLEHMQASGEFDRILRQATGIAKAPYVAAFVRMLVESGEPVVLFGWHRAVYGVWMDKLRDLRPVMYTGEESPAAKDRARAAFIEGHSPLLIVSLRSGAGLDGLQARGRTCVFGELDWSPAAHAQCEGRLHRDGQPGEVAAYYLVAEEGSDPLVAGVLGVKREQQAGLIGETGEVTRAEDPDARVRALAEAWMRRAAC